MPNINFFRLVFCSLVVESICPNIPSPLDLLTGDEGSEARISYDTDKKICLESIRLDKWALFIAYEHRNPQNKQFFSMLNQVLQCHIITRFYSKIFLILWFFDSSLLPFFYSSILWFSHSSLHPFFHSSLLSFFHYYMILFNISSSSSDDLDDIRKDYRVSLIYCT